MAAATKQFYFRFRFRWLHLIRKVKFYLRTKFLIQVLRYNYFRCLETNVRHVKNSTSGFHFSLRIIIAITFRLLSTECYPNRTTRDSYESYPFLRWRPRHRNSTSGFVFHHFVHLGRWQSTRRPNFGQIFKPMAQILLFRFLKTYVRHVGILLPVSIFTFASSSVCHSASAYQISSKSDSPRWSYDVIAIVKMAAVNHHRHR